MAAHRGGAVSALDGHVVVALPSFRLDVEVAVADGEVVAVLGPNGAGKSTLLRAVCGLRPLTEGRLRLGGRVVDDPSAGVLVEPTERRVGVVFQDYRLFPHLSARENVAFGPRAAGVGRAEAHRRADHWLARLGLATFGDRRPAQLSGGQAQRVALARALAGDPAALVLDEPLAALDVAARLDVRAGLREHLRAFAGPTMLVTHDPLDALVLADRIVVLEDGRVSQDGAPADVARRPATAYVAALLGLNLLPGTASRGEVTLTDGGVLHATSDGTPDGRVLVALRPSAISLHAQHPEGSARNVWTGVVRGLQTIGDRVRVDVSGAPSVLVDVTPAAVADLGLVQARQVWLSAKATELEVYPA